MSDTYRSKGKVHSKRTGKTIVDSARKAWKDTPKIPEALGPAVAAGKRAAGISPKKANPNKAKGLQPVIDKIAKERKTTTEKVIEQNRGKK